MSDTEKKAKKPIWFILLLLVIGGVLGLGASYGVGVAVHHTSDDAFCVKCHTMQAVTDSYHADVHGGNNPTGFKAQCVECHLPHDSLANYLYTKAATSVHDIRVQFFGDLESIDWEAKRKRASEFTYDSGCMSCHGNVEKATTGDHRAYIAHKEYFEGRTDKSCVECHNHVGHHVLGDYLKK